MYLLSLILCSSNIYNINHFFLICCNSLIGEYLLPPSNKLPRTYRDLTSIMKYVGMEYQAIDACPNDHIIYYK